MKKRALASLPSPAAVLSMNAADCHALWQRVIGGAPPKRASLDFLRGNLAWHLQALAAGENAEALRRRCLARARRAADAPRSVGSKPGTRLVREYHGTTHEVTVLESGYLWCGQRYRSLSHIAREITGSQWSGPRFFGVS